MGIISRCGVRQGLSHVFVHHTSASLMLCENANPTVLRDLKAFMAWCRMATHCFVIPPRAPTTWAHVRSVLTQSAVSIPVSEGRCLLPSTLAFTPY